MDFINSSSSTALFAAALLLLTLLAVRRRTRGSNTQQGGKEVLDTVQAWPPEPARVMTTHERQGYELLKRALPGYMVLAQVPLSRFVRVPMRHSYSEWLQRVGALGADLLVCDAGSRVLAVIDVRPEEESQRSRKRHERLARVLQAAGVRVHVWREGRFPTPAEVRTALAHDLARGAPPVASKASDSRPMPLAPVPSIQQVLADGDAASREAALEPVPSGFYDEFEPAAPGRR
jgi:hypothetical protein